MKKSQQDVEAQFSIELETLFRLIREMGATSHVLLRLYSERQRDGKHFTIRRDALAQDLSLSVRTVQREIKKLQDLGLIQVVCYGTGTPNLYKFNQKAIQRLFKGEAEEPAIDDASHTNTVTSVTSRQKDDPSDDHAATTAVTLQECPQDGVVSANNEVNPPKAKGVSFFGKNAPPSKRTQEQIEQDFLEWEQDDEFAALDPRPHGPAQSNSRFSEAEKEELIRWAYANSYADEDNPSFIDAKFAEYRDDFERTDDNFQYYVNMRKEHANTRCISSTDRFDGCITLERLKQALDGGALDEDWEYDEG